MANKSLNLKYSKKSLSFFSDIAEINTGIKEFKKSKECAKFTIEDETEIGRGKSYAFLQELQDDVDAGRQVTIASFRSALSKRGVKDIAFQNKILCLIIQEKAGIQFPIAPIVDNLFFTQDCFLFMNQDREISLEVHNKKRVSLVFEAIWCDANTQNTGPAISVSVRVNITPDKVTIADFGITKLSDSEQVEKAYKFLESQQQNILEKILSYIKRLFGFDAELRLEETSPSDTCWAPSV